VLYSIRERTLRTAIEIDLALEDVEAGTDGLYLVIAQHGFLYKSDIQRAIAAKALPNFCTSSKVL
jgi:hypothetical protein